VHDEPEDRLKLGEVVEACLANMLETWDHAPARPTPLPELVAELVRHNVGTCMMQINQSIDAAFVRAALARLHVPTTADGAGVHLAPRHPTPRGRHPLVPWVGEVHPAVPEGGPPGETGITGISGIRPRWSERTHDDFHALLGPVTFSRTRVHNLQLRPQPPQPSVRRVVSIWGN
jgi:hypothetical protein